MRIGGLRAGASFLVLLIILAVGYCSSSEARAEGFMVSYGPVYKSLESCDSYGLSVGQEIGTQWEARLVVHGEGICQTRQTGLRVRANIGAGIIRVAGDRVQFGIGAFLWDHDSAFFGDAQGERSDIQFSAILLVRWNVTEKVFAELFHASTGSSTPTNAGLNKLLFGYKF